MLLLILLSGVTYLYFSIPLNHYLMKRKHAVDLEEIGSTNISIYKVFKYGSKSTGICLVLIQAASLLILFSLASRVLNWSHDRLYLLLFSAMLGNMYSIFMGFKGSKGRTLLIWGMLYLQPLALIFMGLIWFIPHKFFNKSTLGTVINCIFLPLFIYYSQEDMKILIGVLLISFLVLVNQRHRTSDFKTSTEGVN